MKFEILNSNSLCLLQNVIGMLFASSTQSGEGYFIVENILPQIQQNYKIKVQVSNHIHTPASVQPHLSTSNTRKAEWHKFSAS